MGCGCGEPAAVENFDCFGNCLIEVDECGICGGNGIAEGYCDCVGNVDLGCGCGESVAVENFDCFGDCLFDVDCNGECGGNALIDACGECDGLIDDSTFCPLPGFQVSYENINFEQNSIDVRLNNETNISGFQFDVLGLSITNVESIAVSEYGFTISNSLSSIVGFSLSGTLPPSNQIDDNIF